MIDWDMSRGCSYACPTFDSPQLGASPEFHVKDVELWGLVSVSEAEGLSSLSLEEKPQLVSNFAAAAFSVVASNNFKKQRNQH
jgi:hypothetical protein